MARLIIVNGPRHTGKRRLASRIANAVLDHGSAYTFSIHQHIQELTHAGHFVTLERQAAPAGAFCGVLHEKVEEFAWRTPAACYAEMARNLAPGAAMASLLLNHADFYGTLVLHGSHSASDIGAAIAHCGEKRLMVINVLPEALETTTAKEMRRADRIRTEKAQARGALQGEIGHIPGAAVTYVYAERGFNAAVAGALRWVRITDSLEA